MVILSTVHCCHQAVTLDSAMRQHRGHVSAANDSLKGRAELQREARVQALWANFLEQPAGKVFFAWLQKLAPVVAVGPDSEPASARWVSLHCA